jgi:hypothetical protein
MSSLPLTPEQRAQKWGTVAKCAAILGIGWLVAPIVFTAITGLFGLLAAGVIMLATWVALPAIGDVAKNLRLKLIKAEAARNPIETLEGEYLRRSQLLNERKNKIETLAAKTNGFGSKLATFKRDYPGEAQTFQDIYDKMVLLLKRSREQWVLAEKQLDAFEGEITKAKAKWAMALAAADLRQDAGRVEQEFLAKLKVECSFDTIEMGMNSAFAQLDTLLMESESVEINVTPASTPAALPAPSSTAIDAEVLNASKTPIRR